MARITGDQSVPCPPWVTEAQYPFARETPTAKVRRCFFRFLYISVQPVSLKARSGIAHAPRYDPIVGLGARLAGIIFGFFPGSPAHKPYARGRPPESGPDILRPVIRPKGFR